MIGMQKMDHTVHFRSKKLLNDFMDKVRASRAARLALFDAEVEEHELRNVVPEL